MTEEKERGIRDLVIDREDVNLGLLHQELTAALGTQCCGVSKNGGKLRIHLFDDTPESVDSLVRNLVTSHDPKVKSQVQQDLEAEAAILASVKGKKPTQWKSDEKDQVLEILLRRLL